MTTMEAPVGAKVSVSAGVGHVRWTGSNPSFSAGKWVGVELLEATGKNDGSVKGEKYFTCEANHGVFVRPSQVKILEMPKAVTSRPASTRPPATPSGSRLSSTDATRGASPQKPSSRAGPSTPPRATSRSSAQTLSPPAASGRKSTASPVAPRHRSTTADVPKKTSSAAEATPIPSRRMPTPVAVPDTGDADGSSNTRATSPPPTAKRVTSPLLDHPASLPGSSAAPARSLATAFSPTLPPVPLFGSSQITRPSRPVSPVKEASAVVSANKRELEELRIKLRILEHRKVEDGERIRSLESTVGEADTLRAARVKLQAKFQELQSSLVAAQRHSRDVQSENVHLESRAAEALDQLEMAAVDREVAEERAEAAESELAKSGEKISELELEVALLKEENAEYERPVGSIEGERNSLAFVQLEKHNERLKEALIRLRDVFAEAEREHKGKLADLEKELHSRQGLVGRLELSEAKLGNAEAHVEDLKLQLDDALGAEDMLEQLTERNLQMGERIEEMRVTIDDLEALKELNDELEENHVEAENQLSEEVDAARVRLREERLRSSDLDRVILDREATIMQFRDLVTSLQIDIDALRLQQATVETTTASTTKEAQALMNLNFKLQTTAVKTQSKTVELELKRIEASQLAEHMRIIEAYLPDAYYETEADPARVLLFFKRIASKTDMLIGIISQIHNLPAALNTAASEILVGVCELRGHLRHFSTLNRRFSAVISRCSTEDWLRYGKVLSEVVGVETKVDGWIALVKADEFNEGDCARDLASLIAHFDHLAETTFGRTELDVAEVQLGLAYGFDYDLDNFAAAVGFARQAVMGLASEDDIEVDVGESSLEDGVYAPVQRILDLVRGVKVPSGKLTAQMEEMVQASKAMLPEVTLVLKDLANSVSNAVDLAVQLAQRIGAHVASIRSSKQPLRLADIERFLDEVTADSSAASDAPPWELIGMFISRLSNEIGVALPKIRQAVQAGQVVSMSVPPPWLARVSAIKEAAAYNADTERKVARLSEELKDMLREIKIRDQNMQESGVKVETLERRLEATRKQADVIVELENDVAKARKQEKVYEDAIEQLQAEQDGLEAENLKLRKGHGAGDRQANASSSSALGVGEPSALSAGGLEASQLSEQVENLRSAVRFLRSENALLKSKDLYNDLHLLPALSHRFEQPVPELEPSSALSSPSSSSSMDLPRTPTRHALETESKLLFREITAFQASPRIVDISAQGQKGGWQSKRNSPEQQMWAWKMEEGRLTRRVEKLAETVRSLGVVRRGA